MNKLIATLLFMLLLNSCSDSSSTDATVTGSSQNQFVYLRCRLSTESGQKAYVQGEIYGDKSITFDYCKINGLTVTSHNYTINGLTFGNRKEYATSNLDNLVCEVKTSAGKLNGSLSGLPVTPMAITLNVLRDDTLKHNDTLIVSWDNSNAGFYRLNISSWTQIGSLAMDTLVTGCQVKLSYDTFFKGFNGNIYHFSLHPVCGPVPGKNTKANLTGASAADGLGYFYFYGPQVYHGTRIYLGNGSTSGKHSQPAPLTEEQQAADLDKAIMKKLGVSK